MTTLNIVLGLTNLGSAALVAALSWPLVQRRVKPNHFYGARFKRSFESDELWYAINEHAGRRLIFWSIPVAAAGIACFFLPFDERPLLSIAFGSMAMVYCIAAFESYLYSRRLP